MNARTTSRRINRWATSADVAAELARGGIAWARLIVLDEDGADESESVASLVLCVVRDEWPLAAEWIALGDPDDVDEEAIQAAATAAGLGWIE